MRRSWQRAEEEPGRWRRQRERFPSPCRRFGAAHAPVAGRSLRPSRPSLTPCQLRFRHPACARCQGRLNGTGNPSLNPALQEAAGGSRLDTPIAGVTAYTDRHATQALQSVLCPAGHRGLSVNDHRLHVLPLGAARHPADRSCRAAATSDDIGDQLPSSSISRCGSSG